MLVEDSGRTLGCQRSLQGEADVGMDLGNYPGIHSPGAKLGKVMPRTGNSTREDAEMRKYM